MARRESELDFVDARHAQANLDELLDRVERGEIIAITRNGNPIARLVPCGERVDRVKVERAIADLLELQRTQTLGDDLSVEQLIGEGRGL